ncbi:hypothetical protein H2201_005020 [Coniosporium apollinis]|uniref:Complex I intermediate-associated protein 84, mitochondrial n=2 Tax=Coniosporium TaxID=2810619 RepID=A0ABQ9NQU8_9PEZI|nr:hypothetical protein H2199_000675 [Cladosporium sp. JES 115]KAJ9664799.1 hypothetical protein H2201_005020 [Coniosporium apollinis]
MPSHLTRHVFRRLLSNEPITSRACLYRAPRTTLAFQNVHYRQQRRTIFGFLRKPERKVKLEADLDPGLGKMLELGKMAQLRTRPPPAEDLAKAWVDFFRAKARSKEPLEDIQSSYALWTFTHLQRNPGSGGEPWLDLEDLRVARDALIPAPTTRSDTHAQLAKALHQEILARKAADSSEPTDVVDSDLPPLIATLCNVGETHEARAMVEKVLHDENATSPPRSLWKYLIEGFAREGNEQEVLGTLKLMQRFEIPFTRQLHRIVTVFFAERGDLVQTKYWFNQPYLGREPFPEDVVYPSVLKCALRNNDIEWGQSVIRSIADKNPPKRAWDAFFIWAAGTGKGVEEIDRMMRVMTKANPDDSHLRSKRPDIDTINELVEFAMSRNDPYLAERIILLGQQWDIRPDAKTYILQINYRLSTGDVDGARAAYAKLQAEEVLNNEDIPAINRLVQSMCAARRYSVDDIMAVVQDLNARRTRFEPDTVSALCLLHLERDELHDVIDLLQTHTFHFSMTQRAAIRNVFVNFCLNRANSTGRVWDTYMIFHQIFDETDRSIRTQIMAEFFRRRRPDMAVHVFNHMRQHIRPDTRADISTYVAALQGIAQASAGNGQDADVESLELVHNQMKLDSDIEPNTQLYNALMLAYTACEQPQRALEFWEDIVSSREGPSYNSILIAFWACEKAPFGDRPAKSIWARLRKMEIEITPQLFAAYVGALAGNHLLEEVKAEVGRMEEVVGVGPDAFTLGTVFNATTGYSKQEEVEKWIKESYPSIWEELEKIGVKTSQETGLRRFNIDRPLTP